MKKEAKYSSFFEENILETTGCNYAIIWTKDKRKFNMSREVVFALWISTRARIIRYKK